MRRHIIVLAVTAVCFSSAAQNTFTAHDIYKVKRVSEVAISPDATHVAYTVTIERPFAEGKGSDYKELHVLNLESGESRPYITGDNNLWNIQWKPNSEQVTFMARMSGEKGSALYGIALTADFWQEIAKIKGMSRYSWRPDGNAIAYIASERSDEDSTAERLAKEYKELGFNAEVFEENIVNKGLFVYELESGESKQWSRAGSVFSFEWSPMGDRLAAQIAPQNLVDDSYMFKDIFIVSELGQLKVVDAPGKLGGMSWSPDGENLAFLSAVDINDPSASSLFVADPDEPKPFGSLKNYTADFAGTVSSVSWQDKKTMLFTSNESVDVTLRAAKLSGGGSSFVIGPGKMVLRGVDHSNGMLAFIGNTWEHPDELFTYNLKDDQPERRTNLNPWIDDMSLGKQEKYAWKAKDGLDIEGFITYPVDYQPGTAYPLITYVHGGPESCVSNGWFTYYSTWGQVAAANGYMVFYPNYRSSTGRGVAFSKMGQKDLADEEFTDILDGIDQLIAEGKVNRHRVGIGGGSYGGYFSAWAATKHSERFAAAVSFVGIANQISKRNTTDIPYEDYYVHWLTWTNDDVELIYDRSPVKYASNNKTPTLILHGKEDPRVHPSQSLELYRTLKMHGNAPVRLIWYPGEGHGNRNNPAQLDYAIRTMDWFNYYLLDGQTKGMPPSTIDYGIGPDGSERAGDVVPDKPYDKVSHPDKIEMPVPLTDEEKKKLELNQPQVKPGG